jgi:hypothetical protein
VTVSHGLLEVLKKDEANDFQNLLTGDKPWSYFEYPQDSLWATSRDEVSERIKEAIDTEKSLISVVWFVKGIHNLFD